MKFSISAKKNQLPCKDAAELLCIGTGEPKPKTFAVLGKKNAETAVALFNRAQHLKKPFQAALNADRDARLAVWHIDDFGDASVIGRACKVFTDWLKDGEESRIAVYLDGLNKKEALALMPVLMRRAGDAGYACRAYKSKIAEHRIRELAFVTEHAGDAAFLATFAEAEVLVRAMNFERELADAPANVCTPEFLADEAKNRATKLGIKTKIHNPKQIAELGMNAFLAVARGSRVEPRFIELSYQNGKKSDAPIVLVGKGITFDSGGISLKPGAGMDEMKYDMCGGASVIAALCAAAELKLPLNIIALVPSCENMPSGEADKPGDIVKSLNGLSIEILNTDAEGRLILCDALAYAERFKPQAVIDVATLTGACVIALGHEAGGILGNDQKLIDLLLEAGRNADDRMWQLPLWEEYRDALKSNFADLANVGGRPAGTITAASFFSRLR